MLETLFFICLLCLLVAVNPTFLGHLREDIKKNVDRVKTALLGGWGSEKLMNFHLLQMIKSMEGGGSHSIISLLCGTQL